MVLSLEEQGGVIAGVLFVCLATLILTASTCLGKVDLRKFVRKNLCCCFCGKKKKVDDEADREAKIDEMRRKIREEEAKKDEKSKKLLVEFE